MGMLAMVILVLLLAYLATRAISRYGGSGVAFGGGRDASGTAFRVVARLELGRNERLVLVRIGERCCLIGVTAQSVTLIKELSGEESQLWCADAERPETAPAFLDLLKENLRKRK